MNRKKRKNDSQNKESPKSKTPQDTEAKRNFKTLQGESTEEDTNKPKEEKFMEYRTDD